MKYQLVIQFPIKEDFDFDVVLELETRLTLELGEDHLVDGHDFGAGEINILIKTDNPESGYEKIFDMLSGQLAANLRVAYRLMESEEYIWLHPANSESEFSVK